MKHPLPLVRNPTAVGAALHIVLLYAFFASLWILLSDEAVSLLFREPAAITLVSMVKGWLFVALTSLLLFGLIRRLAGGLQSALATVRQREQELQSSENLLLEAQQIAGLGNYTLDVTSGMWTTSAVCDQVLGIGQDFDHSVRGWNQLVHPEERESMARYFNDEVLGHGHPFDREYRIVRPGNGVERWVHCLGHLELNAQRQVVSMRGTIQDVTDAKQAVLAVEAARAQLQATLDALPDLLFEVGSDGRIYHYHSHRSDLLAAPPEAFLGKRFKDLMPAEVTLACERAILEASTSGSSNGISYPLDLPDGTHWFELSAAPMPTANADGPHFILIVRDISDRMQSQKSLVLAASVFSHAREGITITDAAGTIIDVNASFTRITGYTHEEALGQNPRMLSSGRHDKAFYTAMWRELTEQGYWSGEIWNRRKSGEVFAELITIGAVRDEQGSTVQYVALFSDITTIKQQQNALEHIAHFDALTNLPNRLLLSDRLQQALGQALRREQRLAVAYLDLDGFKQVNDLHGHDVGDQLLIALAQRMKASLREVDTLARIGGDEFVVVLIDLEDVSACVPMLSRLLATVSEPVLLGDVQLQVSASVGVTFFPQTEEVNADQLLRQADQAMYQAKLAGKNRYHVFDAEQDSSMRGHHESLEHIRLALERGEFVLHYQPKVNMRTGQVIGAEALIRWQHPINGLLPPATFLPVIEDHPLAITVGEWVIATALDQLEQWSVVGLNIPVSVNIGARQLQHADFVDHLRAALAAHPHVDPGQLELEILETSALKDIAQVSQVIAQCDKLGVNFALDDFGTGYSSLTYLKRLRVTLLKIDQSFVRDMLADPDDLAILQGVIGLANAFHRDVIAEGVETVAHGTRLLQLGCDLVQGFGIARPMPGADMPAWVLAWHPDAQWTSGQDSNPAA